MINAASLPFCFLLCSHHHLNRLLVLRFCACVCVQVSPQCLYNHVALKPLYTSLLITVLVPPVFVLCTLCILFGLYLKCAHADRAARLRSRFLTGSICIVFLFQPTVVTEALSMFPCVTVGGHRLLYTSVDIKCGTWSHIRWQLFAAASLLVYIVILPGLVLRLLHQNRHSIMYREDVEESKRMSSAAEHDTAVRKYGGCDDRFPLLSLLLCLSTLC